MRSSDSACWLPVSLSSDLVDLESLPANGLHFHSLDAILLLLSVRIDLSCGPKLSLWITCVTGKNTEHAIERRFILDTCLIEVLPFRALSEHSPCHYPTTFNPTCPNWISLSFLFLYLWASTAKVRSLWITVRIMLTSCGLKSCNGSVCPGINMTDVCGSTGMVWQLSSSCTVRPWNSSMSAPKYWKTQGGEEQIFLQSNRKLHRVIYSIKIKLC